MRKVKFVIVCILMFSLIACKGKGSDNSDSPAQKDPSLAVSGTLTASITPGEGWEKREGTAVPIYSKSTGASITLTADSVPATASSPEAYTKFAQGLIGERFKDSVFSDAVKTKVAGMDAIEYTYTTIVMNMPFKYKIVYILKGSKAYTILYASLESEYDEDEFKAILDTYTLN